MIGWRRRIVAASCVATLAVAPCAAEAARAAEPVPSGGTAAGTAGSTRTTPSAEDRAKLDRILVKAFDALPRPAKSFRHERRSDSREIAMPTSKWALATKAPAEAAATHVYEKRTGRGDDAETVTLEIRVYLNRERGLPEPLGSEGGALETFTHDGLPCMRASLAGAAPSRLALPLDSTEQKNALTVLRAHVGAASVEPYLADIAQGRTPEQTPWDRTPARRPSDVRTIVVEFYGPRADVEELMKRTSAAPLRALLTP